MLLGKLLLARGDVERARVELEKAVELDGSSMTAAYLLGQVYRKAGRTEDANRLFAKVSESKTEDPARVENRALLRIVRENMQSSSVR
jgi:Flp pilus assembly protein TadD